MIRDYLQLFRAHTGMATVYTLLIPYLFVGGRVFAIPLFVLGLITHYASFGHNSVSDYYHDLQDENKKHHPLITGRIKYSNAVAVVFYMQMIAGIGLAVIALLAHSILSLVFLVIYVVAGHAYNDGLDHQTIHSFIPISIAFSSLTLYSYFLDGTNVREAILFFILAFLLITYQIAYEGNKKDQGHEVNYYSLYGGKMWFETLFFVMRVVGDTVLLLMIAPTYLVIAFTPIEIYLVVMSQKERDHTKMLKYFGLTEAVEFFRVVSLLNILLAIPLIVVGLAYFMIFNKLLWSDHLLPKV